MLGGDLLRRLRCGVYQGLSERYGRCLENIGRCSYPLPKFRSCGQSALVMNEEVFTEPKEEASETPLDELSPEEWEALMEIIENPPVVPAWLRRAVRGDDR